MDTLQIRASRNHRTVMKPELSRLIPRKLAANLELLIVPHYSKYWRNVALAIMCVELTGAAILRVQ